MKSVYVCFDTAKKLHSTYAYVYDNFGNRTSYNYSLTDILKNLQVTQNRDSP